MHEPVRSACPPDEFDQTDPLRREQGDLFDTGPPEYVSQLPPAGDLDQPSAFDVA